MKRTAPPVFQFKTSKVILVVFLAVFMANSAIAQDYDHYQPIRCMGPIPEELRTSSTLKYQEDLSGMTGNMSRKEETARKDFLLHSNFILDDLMLSGKIVFGDPVTSYLNRVKDQVLQKDPDLAKKIRVYLVKSPIVNAFATNSGAILVNMGLVAHLSSEAELAFVLCHEIQHFVRQHPIEGYVNTEKLRSNPKDYNLSSYNELLEERSRYNREQELEADKLGFQLYKQSGYSMDAAESVFDLLVNAEQPFDDIPWLQLYFESDLLRFPNDFTRKKLDTTVVNLAEDDKLSTHPNIETRRAAIMEELKGEPQSNGESFIVGAGEFLEARKRCRFELSGLFLEHHAFEAAIYNSYLLQVEEPNSSYLKKVIAQSIYGLSVYHDGSRYRMVHQDPDDLGGPFQQLCHFFDRMDGTDLLLVAVRELWSAYLAQPGDSELRTLSEKILEKLFIGHESAVEWLVKERPEGIPHVVDSIMKARVAEPEEDKQVEDKVVKGKKNASEEYLKWSLVDLFQNEQFKAAWDTAKAQNDQSKSGSSAEGSFRELTSRDLLKGWNLGVSNVIVLKPVYRIADVQRKVTVKYVASEEGLVHYKDRLEESFKLTGLEYQMLDNRNLSADQTEQFNDVAFLLDLIADQSKEYDGGSIDLGLDQGRVDEIIQRYGTRFVVRSGIVQVKSEMDPTVKLMLIMVGAMFFPILPFILLSFLKRKNQSLFVTQVFDLKRRQMILSRFHSLQGKARKHITRSILYDNAMQIKGKSK